MDYKHLRKAWQVLEESKGQVCRCTMSQAIALNRVATTANKPGPPFTLIVIEHGEDKKKTVPAGPRKDRLQTEDLKTTCEVWLIPLNSQTGMKARIGRTVTEKATIKKRSTNEHGKGNGTQKVHPKRNIGIVKRQRKQWEKSRADY